MKCPRCKHENPAEVKFCGECGARLESVCPACGASNPPGNKFCGGSVSGSNRSCAEVRLTPDLHPKAPR